MVANPASDAAVRPADIHARRLATIRILVGAYALLWLGLQLPSLLRLAASSAHYRPTGALDLLFPHAPPPPSLTLALALITLALLALAFVLGIAYRALAPLAALGLLFTLSARNSWGMIFHTENLLVLHTLALAVAPAAHAYAIHAARRPPPRAGYRWPLVLLAALTAATYLLAAIAKLRLSGLGWIDGETLRNQIAVDNARKLLLGGEPASLATALLDHPAILTGFSAASLVVELVAPLALLHRRAGQLWALAAWGFHVGVVLLMNIWFFYPLTFTAFLPLLAPERLWRFRNVLRRRPVTTSALH